MSDRTDLAISPGAYAWCSRAFEAVEDYLGLKVRLHDPDDLIARGHIFLFNHFARFETVIPPYLIYRRSGAYARSIADHALFEGSDSFARLLIGLGAVPNDLPGLLPFLAAEILRGRKVVVFPEGGMVKDRRVVDRDGGYSVYSRVAMERRKHHRGAAVLALTLDIFKERIRELERRDDRERLERWRRALDLPEAGDLLAAARTPTLVVPGNITFYPLHIDDNAVKRLVERVNKALPQQFLEELLIESNLILRDTDMDIRLGTPVRTNRTWWWWERFLLNTQFEHTASLEDLFDMRHRASRWAERLLVRRLNRETSRIRDASMDGMYRLLTVNLSHLAAALVMTLVEQNRATVSRETFHTALYLALKSLQKAEGVHLHESVAVPERYAGVRRGRNADLTRFLHTAVQAGLVDETDETYRFRDKLRHSHSFDAVRVENPVQVYANEAAPVPAVKTAVEEAVTRVATATPADLALLAFDDEERAWDWNRRRFQGPRYDAVNAAQTATTPGGPFLLLPDATTPRQRLGVVLVHGFLASPAEMQGLGARLAAAGHPVMGVRLPGHGTSPWDLRERSWLEWLEAVRRGHRILRPFCETTAVVGFSAGGLLALAYAAEHPDGLAGVAAVAAPVALRNRTMALVPLMHGLNCVTTWLPSFDEPVTFCSNDPEHPDINYRHIPVRGLYQLRLMIAETVRRLPQVVAPVLVVQGDNDPVVDPYSADMLMRKLGSVDKTLRVVHADRHGILYEDLDGTQDLVCAFLAGLPSRHPTPAVSPSARTNEKDLDLSGEAGVVTT